MQVLRRRLTLASLLGACVALFLVGSIALLDAAPMIAPPIGATAYVCASSPGAAAASPRNVIVGHGIGLLCGYLAAMLFSAWDKGPALAGTMAIEHVMAASLALALTTAVMLKSKCHHPAAGATTLIIALGVVRSPLGMLHLELGACGVVAIAWLFHRARGVPYPTWRPFKGGPPRPAAVAPG